MVDIALDLLGLTDRPENMAKVFKSESKLGREILVLVTVNKLAFYSLCEIPAMSTPDMSRWESDGLRQGFQC